MKNQTLWHSSLHRHMECSGPDWRQLVSKKLFQIGRLFRSWLQFLGYSLSLQLCKFYVSDAFVELMMLFMFSVSGIRLTQNPQL